MACNKMSVQLDKEKKCSVCKEIVQDATALSCFHSFCKRCLDNMVKSKSQDQDNILKPKSQDHENILKPKRQDQDNILKPKSQDQDNILKPKSQDQENILKPISPAVKKPDIVTNPSKKDEKALQCPLCNPVNDEGKLEACYLAHELLNLHYRLSQGDEKCQCCMKCEGKWNCTDCQMILCTECKTKHSRFELFRYHNVIERSSDETLTLNSLLFCNLHVEDQICINCQDCKEAICAKCIVTKHLSHKTDTLKQTMGGLVPVIRNNAWKLKDAISSYSESKKNIAAKISQVEEEFTKCESEARNNLNDIIERVRKQHCDVILQLQMRKEQELSKLEMESDEIETKKKQCVQVSLWDHTSIDKSKVAALMMELQSETCSNMTNLVQAKLKKSMKVENPVLKPNEALSTMNDSIDKLSSAFQKMPSTQNGRKSEDILQSIPDFFGNILQEVKTKILLPAGTQATKMAVINRDLWVPTPEKSIIRVFNLRNGKCVKQFANKRIKKPRSVCQAGNGDIIVGSENGLHVIDETGQVLSISMDCTFCDVCVCEDKLYAIKYNTENFVQFNYNGFSWIPSLSISSQGKYKYNMLDTIASNGKYTLVTQLSMSNSVIIYKDNIYTTCIDYNYTSPYLSLRDKIGNFLIASCEDHVFSYYNPETDTYKLVEIPSLNRPVAAVYDSFKNILWILSFGKNIPFATKYCIYKKL